MSAHWTSSRRRFTLSSSVIQRLEVPYARPDLLLRPVSAGLSPDRSGDPCQLRRADRAVITMDDDVVATVGVEGARVVPDSPPSTSSHSGGSAWSIFYSRSSRRTRSHPTPRTIPRSRSPRIMTKSWRSRGWSSIKSRRSSICRLFTPLRRIWTRISSGSCRIWGLRRRSSTSEWSSWRNACCSVAHRLTTLTMSRPDLPSRSKRPQNAPRSSFANTKSGRKWRSRWRRCRASGRPDNSRRTLAYASFRATLQDKELRKSDKHKTGSLLGWWQSNTATWPILSRAFRSILCIPASSAKSENNFSDAGNTMTAKRNGLKPKTLDMIMFNRSNKALGQ